MNKIIFPLMFLYACSHADKKAGHDQDHTKNDSPATVRTTPKKRPSVFESPSGYVLTYTSDSTQQKMKVIETKKDIMDFALITTNKIRNISDTISGELTYVDSGGDENDAADDGSGFFYDNWNYADKNGCQLNFRIDPDSVKYIRIQDFGCAKKLKTSSPFETNHVLKRVEIQ